MVRHSPSQMRNRIGYCNLWLSNQHSQASWKPCKERNLTNSNQKVCRLFDLIPHSIECVPFVRSKKTLICTQTVTRYSSGRIVCCSGFEIRLRGVGASVILFFRIVRHTGMSRFNNNEWVPALWAICGWNAFFGFNKPQVPVCTKDLDCDLSLHMAIRRLEKKPVSKLMWMPVPE